MTGTYRVTKVQKTRQGVRVTILRGASAGKPGVEDEIDVSAKRLTLVQFGDRAINPPSTLLQLPAKSGDTWKWAAAKKDGLAAKKLPSK